MNYEILKAKHRKERENYPQSLSLRVHRALSWLDRAERETEDDDARFVFLWVAFNAAYANDVEDRKTFTERKVFMNFLDRLIKADDDKRLYELVWKEFPGSIRMLIDNQYVYQPFWDFQNDKIDEDDWVRRFERSKASATRALGRMDTRRLLAEVFDRLYVLRNQIIHGGATWNSGINRSQMKQGADILGKIVPSVIYLMMQCPDQLWGDACYPVVD